MSGAANRIQAEGVIKNIIREIVQECASRGEGLFPTIPRDSSPLINSRCLRNTRCFHCQSGRTRTAK